MTTCYIERSLVREILLQAAHDPVVTAALAQIDAIPILEDPTPGTFRPTADARAILREMPGLMEPMLEEFYALWEAEGDSRRAGSLIAARYLQAVARIAVFGTVCSGVEPDPERWRATAMEHFQAAVLDVHNAFKTFRDAEAPAEEAP